MKNIFLFSPFLSIWILFSTCSKNEELVTLELSDNQLEFSSEASINALGINTNGNWEVINIPEWCSVEQKAGFGNTTIKIEAKVNNYESDRHGTMSISVDNITKSCTILQKGRISTKLTVSVFELYFVPAGEEKSIIIETDGNWEITNIPEWCEIKQKEGGPGNIVVPIDVKRNNTNTTREVKLKISAGKFYKEVSILQDELLQENTVKVKVAGTLSNELQTANLENTNKLIIIGELNPDDFKTLRSLKQLVTLDIEKTIIKEGVCSYNYSEWKISPENTIPYGAFDGCSNLKSITLPTSVKAIDGDAFKNCTALTSIVIPNNITSFTGEEIFGGCTKLHSIALSENLKNLSNSAFYMCSSLTSLDIPASVTTIDNFCFYESGLTSMVIPESVKNLGYSVFTGCINLKSISIPESITEIGEGMFFGCSSLNSVNWSDNIKILRNRIFWGCTSLESIHLPNQLETIDFQVFWECKNLTSIVLPANIKKLGPAVFGQCESLKEVYILNPEPPIIEYRPIPYTTFEFFDYSKCKFYIPKGSLDSYKSTYWKYYLSNVVEMQ